MTNDRRHTWMPFFWYFHLLTVHLNSLQVFDAEMKEKHLCWFEGSGPKTTTKCTENKTYLHDVSLHWPFHHISFPSVRPWLCLWAGKLVTTEEDFFLNLVSPLQKQHNHHHDYSFNWATFESSSFQTVPYTSASLGGTRPPLWEPLLYVYQRWGEVCVGVTEAPRKHLWLWRLRCQMVFDSLCPPAIAVCPL